MKSIFPFNYKRLLVFIFWLVVLLSVYLCNKEQKGTRLDFEIALHEVGEYQKRGEFYFDTGSGFTASEFITIEYHAPIDGTFSRYSVVLPSNNIDRLRFDPLPASGRLTIKNVVITKYSSKILDFKTSEKDVISLHSIEKIEIKGQALTITANGDDPYLIVANDVTPFFIFDMEGLIRSIWIDIRLLGFVKFLSGLIALVLLSVLVTYLTFSVQPD